MIALVSLLTIVAISVVIVRVASQGLSLTGLSMDLARFQARSALTGTGFTTRESEYVVNHPVRRRIIATLMVLQNAGLVTLVSTLILGFVSTESWVDKLIRLVVLILGLSVLALLSRNAWIERSLDRLIRAAVKRWTDLRVVDYYSLLKLEEDYRVMRMRVEEGNWMEGRPLSELRLPDEGVTILGIRRAGGDYVGVPRGSTRLRRNDELILYGRKDCLDELQHRSSGPSGDAAHDRAVHEQDREFMEHEEQEEARDRRSAGS